LGTKRSEEEEEGGDTRSRGVAASPILRRVITVGGAESTEIAAVRAL